ncbi:hypothetical protein N7540_011444 [Penicillium herquei]|nr:hypothetical protein N7540_011444 [Penicillium herquei]
MFSLEGEYVKPDGQRSQISEPLSLLCSSSEGGGHHIFELLADKWNGYRGTINDMGPENISKLIALPQLVRFHHFTLLWNSSERFSDGFLLLSMLLIAMFCKLLCLTLSVYFNIFLTANPNYFLDIPSFDRWKKRNGSKSAHHGYSESKFPYFENPLHIFSTVWIEFLDHFPEARITNNWRWDDVCYHPRSLLAISIAGYRNTWVGTSICGPLRGFHLHSRYTFPDERGDMISKTIDHYERTIGTHTPTLTDLFVWNEYSLLRSDREISKRLHDLGFRHSFLNFVEVRIFGILLILTIIVSGWFFFNLSPNEQSNEQSNKQSNEQSGELQSMLPVYLIGGIPLCLSLFISFFERPYLLDRSIVVVSGLGYLALILARPYDPVHTLLLFYQTFAATCIFPFSLPSILGAEKYDQTFLGALLGYRDYTGYTAQQYLTVLQQSFGSMISLSCSMMHRSFGSMLKIIVLLLRVFQKKEPPSEAHCEA